MRLYPAAGYQSRMMMKVAVHVKRRLLLAPEAIIIGVDFRFDIGSSQLNYGLDLDRTIINFNAMPNRKAPRQRK